MTKRVDVLRMTKTRRLIFRILVALAAMLTGCRGHVRYTDPGRQLDLELQRADAAADLIE